MYNFFSTGIEKEWYYVLLNVESQVLPSQYDTAHMISFGTRTSTRNFQRSVYSLLDYVGDVGGLLDGLKLIASVLIAPFSSYNYITLLITRLFSV